MDNLNYSPESLKDQKKKYYVSLKDKTIGEAWNSDEFEMFRNIMRKACPNCTKKALCMGGCPLMPEIVFCNNEGRSV